MTLHLIGGLLTRSIHHLDLEDCKINSKRKLRVGFVFVAIKIEQLVNVHADNVLIEHKICIFLIILSDFMPDKFLEPT